MNTSYEFDIVGQEGILTKIIQTQKKFFDKYFQWQYQNSFNLTLLDKDTEQKIKVRNYICQKNGSTLRKITEISYKDKIFSVQDSYAIHPLMRELQPTGKEPKDAASTNDSDKNDVKDKNEGKKVYIFKKMRKNRLHRQGEDQHLRNTKNISKNFCKAFISYLKSEKVNNFARKKIREALRVYNQLLERKKYNNNLIKKIIGSEGLRDLFKHFLQEQAKSWIQQSRVNDKNLHYQAITIYLNLFRSLPLEKEQDESSSQLEESPISENEEE